MKDLIRLLIVDDSESARRAMRKIFESAPHVRIVGEAESGEDALIKIPEIVPDVILLDFAIPGMNGLTVLKHIMIRHSKPVVMIGTPTRENRRSVFEAIKLGAADFIRNPSEQHPERAAQQRAQIINKITLAAQARIVNLRWLRPSSAAAEISEAAPVLSSPAFFCGIGASEGGYAALLQIIPRLNRGLSAAFFGVLHDTPGNVDAFVRYVKTESRIRVRRPVEGAPVKPGVCYLAAAQENMTLGVSALGFHLRMNVSAVNFHRRIGVNRMMTSLAAHAGERCAGVILSGAGDDGLEGLTNILHAGGTVLIQHPDSCMHKEMPERAAESAASAMILPARALAAEINRRFSADAQDSRA